MVLPMRLSATFMLLCFSAHTQVIEFESGGLKYQALTKRAVTVMFAHMPLHVREFSIVQVAVANGSKSPYTIRPEDFAYTLSGGSVVRAAPARDVVSILMEKGSRGDVIKLVNAYEAAIYGM